MSSSAITLLAGDCAFQAAALPVCVTCHAKLQALCLCFDNQMSPASTLPVAKAH